MTNWKPIMAIVEKNIKKYIFSEEMKKIDQLLAAASKKEEK